MREPNENLSQEMFIQKLKLLICFIAILLLAAWVSRAALEPQQPQIVTVRLAETMAKFVEAQARGSEDPEITKTNISIFLHASEKAVQEMGRGGRIILVAEAVLAGNAPDATPELERRIAARLKAGEGQ